MNIVIGISTEQCLSIGTPSQTKTMIVLLALSLERLQLLHNTLTLQIPNHDTTARRSTEPVSRGRETQSVNLVLGLERVEMFRVVQVPEHSGTVLAT